MAETWVLNSTITGNGEFTADFTSNGKSFSSIAVSSSITSYVEKMGGNVIVYTKRSGWNNEAYRTIVFDTSPTGNLLTWLQANGTKQGEPEPTTPKNACLIDGAGYSIKQGKVLKDGTSYTIKKGLTLIDGTMYNIVLSEDKKMHTLTIFGTLYNKSCVKTSTETYSTTGSFEVEDGETITVVAGAQRSSYLSAARVYLNGTLVARGENVIGATYSMAMTSDVQVEYRQNGTGVNARNWAYITT
jgi:hypothetical protein